MGQWQSVKGHPQSLKAMNPLSTSKTASQQPEKQRPRVSQIRSRLRDRFKKDIPKMPQGDIVVYVSLPASKQGKLHVEHTPMPPEQPLKMLLALQEQLPRPDHRLDEHISKLTKAAAIMQGECWLGSPMVQTAGSTLLLAVWDCKAIAGLAHNMQCLMHGCKKFCLCDNLLAHYVAGCPQTGYVHHQQVIAAKR
jgi:hypothetical protein